MCSHISVVGVHRDGGLSQQIELPRECCIKLPKTVDLLTGALAEPVAVVVHALRKVGFNLGSSPPFDNIFIQGAGTLGLLGLAVGAYMGVKSASLMYKYDFQLNKAKKIKDKFNLAVNFIPSDAPMSNFANSTDCVLETVGGNAPTAQQAVEIVNKGGHVILLGIFGNSAPPISLFSLVVKEVTVVGSCCYDGPKLSQRDFDIAIQFLEEHGPFIKQELVTHQLPFSEVTKAFELASQKTSECIKVVVAVSNSS